MYANLNQVLSGTCGVGLLAHFSYYSDSRRRIATLSPVGGCGWLIAGFTSSYKQAYKEICKRWGTPVYQSPVRKNKRSGNQFFFAIWDTK